MSQNDSNSIILQKEKEWRDLLVGKLQRTEDENANMKNDLENYKQKYRVLENDFKHNLRLIQTRDDEIADLEGDNDELKVQIRKLEDQLSDVSVENEKLCENIKREQENVDLLKSKIKENLEKYNLDLQLIKQEKSDKIHETIEAYNEKVKTLERQIILLEAEADRKNQDLLNNVEETIRQKEGTMKRETENLHSEILSYDLKYRLACRELDLVKSGRAELTAELAMKDDKVRELERKINEEDLAYQSELSILKMQTQTEIAHYKEQKDQLSKVIDELTKKLNKRDEIIRQKSDKAKKLQNSIEEKWKSFENEKCHLLKELEDSRDKIGELEEQIEQINRSVASKDGKIVDLNHKMVEEIGKKSGEVRNLKLETEQLRQNLRKKQDELLELRNELEYAIGKDVEESRKREGEKLDWESKLEQVRLEEMSKVEDMIRKISLARDDALAEVRELRNQTNDSKQVKICVNCSQPSKDGSQAEHQQQKPLSPSNQVLNSKSLSDQSRFQSELSELQIQNEQLRQVIKQMTEAATQEMHLQKQQEQPHPPPPDIKDSRATTSIPLNKHIASLAERNRQLQQEKIQVMVGGRKLQARLEAQERETEEMRRNLRERDTEVSQLKFELDSLQRHSGLDTRNLRRRVQELEMELSMTRKESQEYYKGNLEFGGIIEQLQAEVTSLKSEQLSKVPELNFGAQEMLIEQLKKEIEELRRKISMGGFRSGSMLNPEAGDGDDDKRDEDELVKSLRMKLKAAANYIKNLSTEKQVLIQLSNQLRAELMKAGLRIPATSQDRTTVTTTAPRRQHTVEIYGDSDDNHGIGGMTKSVGKLEEKLQNLERLHKDLWRRKIEQVEEEVDTKQYPQTGGRHMMQDINERGYIIPEESSVGGRKSAEEVFKLLDETESLGQSSVLPDNCNQHPANHKANQGPLLWSQPMKLNKNSPRFRNAPTNKRNTVVNYQNK